MSNLIPLKACKLCRYYNPETRECIFWILTFLLKRKPFDVMQLTCNEIEEDFKLNGPKSYKKDLSECCILVQREGSFIPIEVRVKEHDCCKYCDTNKN